MVKKLWWVALLAGVMAGCAAQPAPDNTNSAQSADQAFDNLHNGFNDGQFGKDSKQDGFWDRLDVCKVLGDVFSTGDQVVRLGFFYGVEGEGVLGATYGMAGYDVVFDLYHRQMSVSKYFGGGMGMPGLGVSASIYAGIAEGFQHGVGDWDGYFVNAEFDVGLPFLKDYFSVTPVFFVSGVDQNDDNIISPSEILTPPNGVYGFSVGLSVGVDALPDVLPVSGAITEGLWMPHKSAIRHFYDFLDDTSILGYQLDVELVDHETGELCPSDWPDVDSERECIVEFGNGQSSNTKAALHMAWGICELNGGCLFPLAGSAALSAVAIGAFQDAGNSLGDICPDLAASLGEPSGE